jgi:hypothetical protein
MSVVQAVGGDNGAVAATTLAITIASSIAGSCLIAGSAQYGFDVTGVADNLGQTWIQAFTPIGNTESPSVWYFPNTSAGVTTVTFTYGTARKSDGFVLEESGLTTSSTVDVFALTPLNTFSVGTTWASETTGTTAQADEIALCITSTAAGSDITLALDSASTTAGWAGLTGTGFTSGRINTSANGTDTLVCRRVLSATGTVNCSGTNVTNPGDCQEAIVTFKVLGGPAPRIIFPTTSVAF